MVESYQFDVFLAHNSQDKPQVKSIAQELRLRGLNPWLDEEQIPAGETILDAVFKGILQSKTAALFISLNGLGLFQESIELKIIIKFFVDRKSQGFRVIPILLPGVSDINIPKEVDYLKIWRWIKFEQRIDEILVLDDLERSIKGQEPDKSPNQNKQAQNFSNDDLSSNHNKVIIVEKKRSKRVDELLNPYCFDLNELIKHCLDEVIDKKGLVGLAVPCDEDPFPKNFCLRLKDALDEQPIFYREVVTLDYRNSVNRAVKTIKNYKNLLVKAVVICPVRVADTATNSIADFWQKISDEFTEIEHNLILVMVSSEPILLENKNLIKLNSPRFTKADVHNWVVSVTRALEWGEEKEVKEKWKKKIIGEDIQAETLDIRSVYDNLEYTIEIFQENQELTPKDFLNALD